MNSSPIGIIILAAGESSRMNGSKQLLTNGKTSLLRQAVITATSLGFPVLTVLGANYDEHKMQIDDLNTEVLFNLDWNKGMGNSLKFGLENINRLHPGLQGFMFMVCDQPLLTNDLLHQLVNKFNDNRNIVASLYAGATGVPVIFHRKYYKELMKLPDDRGAQMLVKKYEAEGVDFPQGTIDIDTDDDWKNFTEGKHE